METKKITHLQDLNQAPEPLRIMLNNQLATLKKSMKGGKWSNYRYTSLNKYFRFCQAEIVNYFGGLDANQPLDKIEVSNDVKVN